LAALLCRVDFRLSSQKKRTLRIWGTRP